MGSKKEESYIEEEALAQWEKREEDPLDLETSVELYEHYLNGKDVEDLFYFYKEKIPFGKIVDAKIRYGWDKKKKAQIASLYKKAEERMAKTKANSAFFLSDAIETSQIVMGEMFKKFLVSRDPMDLGTMDLSNLKNYRTFFEMFMQLEEGLNKEPEPSKKVDISGQVQHNFTIEKPKKVAFDAAASLKELEEDNEVIDLAVEKKK